MSEASDNNLKRLFAQAPVVGSDEQFVMSLTAAAVARRRWRRIALLALLPVVAVGALPLAGLAWLSRA